MTREDTHLLEFARQQKGSFVDFKMDWLSHPCLIGKLRAVNQAQMHDLWALGLSWVRHVRIKSDIVSVPGGCTHTVLSKISDRTAGNVRFYRNTMELHYEVEAIV